MTCIHLRTGVHQFKDPFGTCQSVEDIVSLHGDLGYRAVHLLGILEKGRQCADIHASLNDHTRPCHGSQSKENITGVAHNGHEHHGTGGGPGGVIPQVSSQFGISILDHVFPAEDFNFPLPLKKLFHIAVSSGHGLLLAAKVLGRGLSQFSGSKSHEHQCSQNNECHFPAHKQHHDQNTAQSQQIGQYTQQRVAKELAKGICIVSKAAHDLSMSMGIKILERELFHMGKHIPADLVEHLRVYAQHQSAAAVVGKSCQCIHRCQQYLPHQWSEIG